MNVWDLLLNSKDSKEEENEEDIKRTCIWLKEAGFPQYVQMFNDGEFPISLKLVQEDHCDFDGGTLMALFRRIEILNKSAETKSGITNEEFSNTIKTSTTITRKSKYEIIEDESDSENEEEEDDDDDDDDKENVLEQTALSSNWSYEHRTRRWSHIESTKNQVETNSDTSTSGGLENYLGISYPRPYIFNPKEKQKRPSHLSVDYRQGFDPIPEINSELHDIMELSPISNEKDSRFSTSLPNESRDSGDCLSPTSPDRSYANVDPCGKDKSSHILRSTSLRLMKAVNRLSSHQLSFKNQKRSKHDHFERVESPVNVNRDQKNSDNLNLTDQQKDVNSKNELSFHDITSSDKANKLKNESFHVGNSGWINARTGSFISRTGNQFDEDEKKAEYNVLTDLDPIISLLESDVDSLDLMRSKIRLKSSSGGSAPNSPVLRKKTDNQNDFDKSIQRLSDIESYTHTKVKGNIHLIDPHPTDNKSSLPSPNNQISECDPSKDLSPSPKINRNSATRWSHSAYPNNKERKPKVYKFTEFSVTQVNILKKLSVLGCTSTLEKYCPSTKNVFNWKLPRLLSQKQKLSLEESTSVFGVNLYICQIRYGQPYPPAILNIFQYLREQGPSAQGIFRKAGMKSRSKILKNEINDNANFNSFDEYGVFDVADVLKVFFRDLPDRLLTGKLSATLVAIYSCVPKEHQLDALQLALLSIPDENRTALEILLEFLSFLSSHSEVTKMDVKNLSLIFAPNLFNFPTETNQSSTMSPLRNKKSNGPNVKHLQEQNAAQLCIMDMIINVRSLFLVSAETLRKNHNKMNNSKPKDISQLLSTGLYQEWLCEQINQLKADTVNHKSGWTNISKDYIKKLHGTKSLIEQLSYRKIGSRDNNSDGIALRTWKVVVDIDISPGYLFTNIKEKRHIWDPSITTSEVLQEMNDYIDLVRFTSCNADGSSIPRCFNLLRGYQLGMNGSTHIIVAESVNIQHLMTISNDSTSPPNNSIYPDPSAITGQIFCDNFMIEALSNKTTRVTWISKVDLYGHHSDWYSCHWGHCLVKRATGLKIFSETNVNQQAALTSSNTPSVDVIFCPKIEEPQQNITDDVLNASRETVL